MLVLLEARILTVEVRCEHGIEESKEDQMAVHWSWWYWCEPIDRYVGMYVCVYIFPSFFLKGSRNSDIFSSEHTYILISRIFLIKRNHTFLRDMADFRIGRRKV